MIIPTVFTSLQQGCETVYKGTKNPAHPRMNGKIFVVKECQAIILGRMYHGDSPPVSFHYIFLAVLDV